jgi:hypothetical protein
VISAAKERREESDAPEQQPPDKPRGIILHGLTYKMGGSFQELGCHFASASAHVLLYSSNLNRAVNF